MVAIREGPDDGEAVGLLVAVEIAVAELEVVGRGEGPSVGLAVAE